jgi:microcin C transport system permease protein
MSIPKTAAAEKFLWWRIRPLTARRIANFRANKRGLWSLRILIVLVLITLPAEFIANDRPMVVWYDGGLYSPALKAYPETAFGGEFETEADYTDPYVQRKIREKGWMLFPLIPFRFDTQVIGLPAPSPTPPSSRNWLGTDDQARDLLARVIYGFRISVLFGVTLTVISSIIGIAAGAVQGYFGGRVDLYLQRFIEIWESVPILFLLIILSAIIEPNFWWLLGIMLLFSWMTLTGVVRAEFLRARNFDYVRAARALGASDSAIMLRHVLPNAMVATLTYMPFILSGSLVVLASLDFLGFGLPPGSASLGELLGQAQRNLAAPWIGITAFVTLALLLALVVFVGEAVRDAFDPRKTGLGGGPAEPEPEAPAAPTPAPAPAPTGAR